MTAALSIGEFSRITHLSIKTLRRYHEAGLIEPAHVDPQSAYRYYSLDQVPTAQVVHRFRELGMPVREVGELVALTDPDARAGLIAQHLKRLESQLDQTRAAVVSLRRLLEPSPASLEVHHLRTEATKVAAVRDVVDLSDALSWYGSAMNELDAVLHAAAAGPTVLDDSLGSPLELDHAKAVVFTPGLGAMHIGSHMAQDPLHPGPAQEPVAERDAMTAHVHEDAAA